MASNQFETYLLKRLGYPNPLEGIPSKAIADKKPYPATINPTLVPIADATVDYRYPTWMDKNGVMYGYKPMGGNLTAIVKSTDYWGTFAQIGASIDTASGTNGAVQTVLVSNTGRVIVGTLNGQVFVSDTAQTTFSLAFTFDGGSLTRLFAHNVHENVIILASYAFKGDANYGNTPREIYLSTDDGTTFTKILTRTIPDDTVQAHIHDVEYDPYANRIWVVVGDNPNRQLLYSDDFGVTWVEVYSMPINQTTTPQFTTVIAFPHGVIFGTDSAPEGFFYWKRPTDVFQPKVKPSDIILLSKLNDDSPAMVQQFPTRRWHVKHKDLQVCLSPWVRNPNVGSANGMPRLFATLEGHRWYEIYRAKKKAGTANYYGLLNIIGPHPADAQRRIFGIWQDDTSYYVFKATLPEFV